MKMVKQCVGFLSMASISFLSQAQTIGEATSDDSVTVIEPAQKNQKDKITEVVPGKIEVGAYMGTLSIEDFDSNQLLGLSASFHFTQRIMGSLYYGRSSEANATFEESLGQSFVPEREDGFSFAGISAAYNLFQGKSYFSQKYKFNSYIYAEAGLEQVDFAGDSNTGFLLGAKYKIIANEWLSGDLNFRNHIVNRDLLGEDKLTQNLEFSIGISAHF